MSYRRESPCVKYYEKAKGDELRKSLSATRFPPNRRTSDPSSDDSDDFHQLDIGEDQSSSISRSSSESCHSLGYNRCQLRKLDEIRSSRSSLSKMQIFDDNFPYNNETLDEFTSRLRIRRSKTRDKSYSDYCENDGEGDRSDFSYDSTTKEAHEEILRNAESLRLEQAENYSMGSKKVIRCHKPLNRANNGEMRLDFTEEQSHNKLQVIEKRPESIDSLQSNEETLSKLCARRQEEIRLATLTKRSSLDYEEENQSLHGLQRSSTDYFGQSIGLMSDNASQKTLSASAKKLFSSPRLKRKTQTSQVLRAAQSIPSLIFPLKSNKSKTFNTTDILDSSQSNTPDSFGSKKSSIDEGLICVTPKTRRSPLRFIGNFVDDKILRGRWGSTKRAKSSVELGRLSWEIPDDLTDNSGSLKLSRRKSSNKEDNEQKVVTNSTRNAVLMESVDTTPKTSVSILKRKPRSLSTGVGERPRSRIASSTSDRLSLSSSSAIGSDDADIFIPQQQPFRTEISADALAEIEAFERLAQSLLNESPSEK